MAAPKTKTSKTSNKTSTKPAKAPKAPKVAVKQNTPLSAMKAKFGDKKSLVEAVEKFTSEDLWVARTNKDKGLAHVSNAKLLRLLSIFTDQMRVKAIRAILCGGAKAIANASGVKVNQQGGESWRAHMPGRLTPTADGYRVHTHKLGYGMAHALFITRMPGFMKVVTEESLWQELNDVRFTTPILREWVPYIETTLRYEERLEDAHPFNCKCGILTATTQSLDKIVSEGLQQRELIIPRPALVA